MAKRAVKKTEPTVEMGASGLKAYAGTVSEEADRQLSGERGPQQYRKMSDSDPIVGSVLNAIDLLLRKADIRVEPAESDTDRFYANFVESLFGDMSHTWDDFISEALTFLTYGWSYFETIFKVRNGPDQADSSRRSLYDDGLVGIRKIAPRSQDTRDRWELQNDGGILGMWQRKPNDVSSPVFLPISRCLLFRTISRKNNPEGRSILRNAFRPWFFLSNIQDVEAVGIERELAGLPVLRIPAKYLNSQDPQDQAIKSAYENIARDLKFNQQGALLIPSDTFKNADGTLSEVKQVDITLISTNGRRQIDTSAVVLRYQRDIARSALADFIMLGTDGKGSYALSEDKTDLFLTACETYLNQISSPINRILLPRLWSYNNFPMEMMPQLSFGRIAPVNLGILAKYIADLNGAGMAFFPDEGTEDYLRRISGLPKKGEDLEQAEADGTAATPKNNQPPAPQNQPPNAGEND